MVIVHYSALEVGKKIQAGDFLQELRNVDQEITSEDPSPILGMNSIASPAFSSCAQVGRWLRNSIPASWNLVKREVFIEFGKNSSFRQSSESLPP
jgi:hypothetical protein